MDVGGDEVGAKVLGSVSDAVPRSETECLVVLNFRRPSTPDAVAAAAMVRQIESASKVAVTGLISNTHLMRDTTPAIVVEGHRLAEEVADALDIPVVAVAATRDVADDLRGHDLGCQILVLDRVVLPPFEQPLRTRASGPLFVVN
jgi:hypothetical protein